MKWKDLGFSEHLGTFEIFPHLYFLCVEPVFPTCRIFRNVSTPSLLLCTNLLKTTCFGLHHAFHLTPNMAGRFKVA